MFYNRAVRKKKLLRDEINSIEALLPTLPEGSFTCQKNRNSFKWRVTKGKLQFYIPKDRRDLAEQYAYKKYLTCRLSRLKNEELAIQAYLNFHNRHVNLKDDVLLTHPEYKKLLSKFVPHTSYTMLPWMNAPYKRNPYYKQDLIHDTSSGIKVRSKNEQLIVEALIKHNLAFRYEEELVLGDNTYYPDFEIIHPQTGKVIFWENIGKIEDPDRLFRQMNKLQHYFQYGYYPSINLILTFDTEENPLTSDRIERIIEMYFDE